MKTLNDLANMFDKLANKIDESTEKGLERTAQHIYQDVVELAPVATGVYRDSIQIFPIEKNDSEMSVVIGSKLNVGPAKVNGNYYNLGKLLEHGTLPHDIYPYDAQSLRFEIDGQEIFVKHVWHPGTIAQPHYSLALEKNKKLLHKYIVEEWRQ